jgi:hypothetical protein
MCTTLWALPTKAGQVFGDKSYFSLSLYNYGFYNQLPSSLSPVYRRFLQCFIIYTSC